MIKKLELDEETLAKYAQIGYYYHKDGMTQAEIADRMQMSRQRVNRILGECIELGIVEVRICAPSSNILELESEIESRYNLKKVRVVNGVTKENAHSELGFRAGQYLSEIMRDNDVIGFSRGATLGALADQLPVITRKGLVVTQLMGGWNSGYSDKDGDDIIRRFSRKIRTDVNCMFAPVMVHNEHFKQLLFKEPYFMKAYEIACSSTIAVLGIGEARTHIPLPASEKTYFDALPDKTAGEVCTHFYDIEGVPVKTSFDDRIVAISLEDLKRIPIRIGVAGMPSKLSAIKGAIRGGYINVLITDSDTASALCR